MSKPADLKLLDVSRLAADKATARLIEYAAMLNASDLFFATDDEQVTVQIRHLGMVQTISAVTAEAGKRMIQHIKAAAQMDLTEKRRPADGRWIYRPESGPVCDLRVSVVPTLHGEDLSLRLLIRESQLFTLDTIGLTRQQHAQVLSMLEGPSGLVLLTGPTGSGKTATLYACLAHLNDGQKKINTIEDPIEFAVAGIRQSQVNGAVDLGFAELLRSVLRQSPDVIMIGEIRDAETAETAVRAANSGHLVLATIHAGAAAGAIQSMRALGVNPHFLATALRGIVSQRLVRTLCTECKVTFDLSGSPHTFDEVRPWLAADEGKTLFAARGCPACSGLGYLARTGVFEVMPISKTIRNMISDNAATRDIRAKAVEEHMMEFRQAALLKVALGSTSIEEVFRVIPSEHLMLEE